MAAERKCVVGHDSRQILHCPAFKDLPRLNMTLGAPEIGSSGSKLPLNCTCKAEDERGNELLSCWAQNCGVELRDIRWSSGGVDFRDLGVGYGCIQISCHHEASTLESWKTSSNSVHDNDLRMCVVKPKEELRRRRNKVSQVRSSCSRSATISLILDPSLMASGGSMDDFPSRVARVNSISFSLKSATDRSASLIWSFPRGQLSIALGRRPRAE